MPASFRPAADVVPWIGVGVALQGVYLLTSIGLNITKHTEYYPIATGVAAAASISANLALVPTFGIMGAAWANTIAYAVLAVVSWRYSHRYFPITYEVGRLARVVLAAVLALAASRLLVPPLPPLVGLIAHGSLVLAVFVAVLALSGFFVAHEIEQTTKLLARIRRRMVISGPSETTELAGELVTTPATDLAVEVQLAEPPEAAPGEANSKAPLAPGP
jgi:O-antigen/teichoic acid export membrane protein